MVVQILKAHKDVPHHLRTTGLVYSHWVNDEGKSFSRFAADLNNLLTEVAEVKWWCLTIKAHFILICKIILHACVYNTEQFSL